MFTIVLKIMSTACKLITLIKTKLIKKRGGFNHECSFEYTGPLCSSCLYNDNFKYYKITDDRCAQCPNLFGNIIIFVVLLLFIGICLVILIKYLNY